MGAGASNQLVADRVFVQARGLEDEPRTLAREVAAHGLPIESF